MLCSACNAFGYIWTMTRQEIRVEALRAAVAIGGRTQFPTIWDTMVACEAIADYLMTGESYAALTGGFRLLHLPRSELRTHYVNEHTHPSSL